MRDIEPANNSDNDSYDDMNAFLDACGASEDQPESQQLQNRERDDVFIKNLLVEFDGSSEPLQCSVWEVWAKKTHKSRALSSSDNCFFNSANSNYGGTSIFCSFNNFIGSPYKTK